MSLIAIKLSVEPVRENTRREDCGKVWNATLGTVFIPCYRT